MTLHLPFVPSGYSIDGVMVTSYLPICGWESISDNTEVWPRVRFPVNAIIFPPKSEWYIYLTCVKLIYMLQEMIHIDEYGFNLQTR